MTRLEPIATERLLLRAFAPEDAAALLSISGPDEDTRYTRHWPSAPAQARAFVQRAMAEAAREPCAVFEYAAVSRATGELIGSCNFVLAGDSNLGWLVQRSLWGRGYATEMGRAMLRLGFEALGLPRIVACCDADNVASWRVMEKLGMRREGFYPDARLAYKGSARARSDEVTYALDRADWAARPPAP
ncbi:MAG: GNAT family N-acetyltransferase [Christensenellales bacterium]|jgi:ribosomal-protein-alanine N-acetyltransferase